MYVVVGELLDRKVRKERIVGAKWELGANDKLQASAYLAARCSAVSLLTSLAKLISLIYFSCE